jgi:hypothetical protein
MDVELSPQHDELIRALYRLRKDMPNISRDERLIIEAAIQMLEYLDEYAMAIPAMGDHTDEEIRQNIEATRSARRRSEIRWTCDDFEHLLCSGGFELSDGRLRPRF